MFNYGNIIEYIDGTYDENFNNAHKWALSNHATFNELIDKRQKINGVLHRFFEIKEIIIPKPTLEELKIQKRNEINKARDKAEQGGFKYMDKVFDSDLVSSVRIQGAAQLASQMPMSDTPVIEWTCKDNSHIMLTTEELLGLSAALAQWSNECHKKATELKQQIDAAKTEEELNAIKW